MQRLSFALASLLVFAAAPALAEEDQVSNVPQVSISDLDLNTPAGLDAALDRIRRASRDDCGINDQRNIDIGIYAIMHACERGDIAAQVDRVDSDVLRARYEERTNGWR